ncbi:MAG: hypothetical protein J6A75_07950 [Lachnospiraceae bacterium]|nr:hypothetical protein [Lachnospiraceae bacterium]
MKQTMKKFLSMFLAFAMILTMIPTYGAKAEESSNKIIANKVFGSDGQSGNPEIHILWQ